MKTLITPADAVRLAFAEGDYLPPETITESDIAAAEARWIVPVVGRRLHARLLEGAYADFTADCLAVPVALCTRLLVQPLLDARTGAGGAIAPRSDHYQAADAERCRRLRRALAARVRTLLARATVRLDAEAPGFPEYDPEENILKRCRIDGNLVQIR